MVAKTEKTKRNPPWTRDEIILALDLYQKLEGTWPAPEDTRVQDLSHTLNRLWRAQGVDGVTLRNPNGVKMKLMNLRSHDPAFEDVDGLKAGNRLEVEVWNDFAGQPQHLRETAEAIRLAIMDNTLLSTAYVKNDALSSEEVDAPEGRILTVMHHSRERSRKIIQAKKKAVLTKTGRLACEACGFDFAQQYGDRGQGFIECHHIKPLCDLPKETRTRLDDLALVCANCHRMIHAQRPWLNIEELSDLIRSGSMY